MAAADRSEGKRPLIAIQACESCRRSKTKCDEKRPECSRCERLSVSCSYSDGTATKKEAIVTEIFGKLADLEERIDEALNHQSISSQRKHSKFAMKSTPVSRHSAVTSTSVHQKEPNKPYKYMTAPHRVIIWPKIQSILAVHSGDLVTQLHDIQHQGTTWFLRKSMANKVQLPAEFDLARQARYIDYSLTGSVFPGLCSQDAVAYAEAFFDCYHPFCPILDEERLMETMLPNTLRGDLGECETDIVLTLFVLALGKMAYHGESGGFPKHHGILAVDSRKDPVEQPSGIEIFNEARRGLGAIATSCTLDNVRIYLLQATYHAATGGHLEFWRCAVEASRTCQLLLQSRDNDWVSPENDMIKRVFWACVINEDHFHLDLDLPRTGVFEWEDHVALPTFSQDATRVEHFDEDVSAQPFITGSHFLATLTLRKLISRIHSTLEAASNVEPGNPNDFESTGTTVAELNRQLESWRLLLPQTLQWLDHQGFQLSQLTSTSKEHSTLHMGAHVRRGKVFDIMLAQLHSRYSYARYMIHRPFIYKSLHFPELMSHRDEMNCALAIRSACLWPILTSPSTGNKRLIPHLFSWTQNFTSILFIMVSVREDNYLRQICEANLDLSAVRTTTKLMLQWLQSMERHDGVANWCRQVLVPWYQDSLF